MTRGKDFREELTTFIADRFRELKKVDAVNVNFDGDLKTVAFTILVDMPEYDDELMDQLLDVELDWAPKAAGWGVRVSCIYLPSSFVEPDLCLSSTTINLLSIAL
jgi:hypothetical protein